MDDDFQTVWKQDNDPPKRWTAAFATVRQADERLNCGDTDGALYLVNEALELKFGDEELDDEMVAFLFLVKARYLAEAGRMDEVLAISEQAIENIDNNATADWNQQMVAHLRLFHPAALSEVGRTQEALAEYDEIATSWSDEDEPSLREAAATALRYSARQLTELGRANEAKAELDRLVERYGNDPAPNVRAEAASGMAEAAIFLTRANERKRALRLASHVVHRYRGSHDPDIRAALAAAYVCQLHILPRRLRLVAYLRVWFEFLRFIGREPEPKVIRAVVAAHPSGEKLLRHARTFNS